MTKSRRSSTFVVLMLLALMVAGRGPGVPQADADSLGRTLRALDREEGGSHAILHHR